MIKETCGGIRISYKKVKALVPSAASRAGVHPHGSAQVPGCGWIEELPRPGQSGILPRRVRLKFTRSTTKVRADCGFQQTRRWPSKAEGF